MELATSDLFFMVTNSEFHLITEACKPAQKAFDLSVYPEEISIPVKLQFHIRRQLNVL